MTLQRQLPDFSLEQKEIALKDPRRHYYPIVKMALAFTLEYTFALYRRMMFGAMRDPSAAVFAVVVNALEEAVLRSTMVLRDTLFRRLLGKAEMTDTELLYQRKTW